MAAKNCRRDMALYHSTSSVTVDASTCIGAEEKRRICLGVCVLAIFGLCLRLWAAQGDLWLDEIWSVRNVEALTSLDQVFWRINHDNNHPLNSAWLYLVGADAQAPVQRLLSALLGAATVAAAAWMMTGRELWTPLVAAMLFFVSYPMVHFGSEARGYVGLVLCLVLAVRLVERRLDGHSAAWRLAATAACGFLFHMTMLAGLAVIGLWVLWLLRDRGLVGAVAGAWLVLWPVGAGLLPVLLLTAASARLLGFTVGGYTPFSLEHFAAGYGGMIDHLFGLPAWVPDWTAILLTILVVVGAYWRWNDRRGSLYLIGIVVLPVSMLMARLPNLEFPRYFLISGTLLLLLASEMIGRGLEGTGPKRLLSGALLAAIVVGSTHQLHQFSGALRGGYKRMVETMTADGPASYATNHPFRTGMTVAYYADRAGKSAVPVSMERWCAEPPAWFVLESDRAAPEAISPAAACTLSYDLVDVSVPWGLSGMPWALYKLN